MRYQWRAAKAKYTVIKEIRANLMLGWLSENFPIRIVFVTRHPCAVVGSRMRLGWDVDTERILVQPELLDEFLSPFEGIIREAKSTISQHAVNWCVENLIPLHQIRHYGWLWTAYEAFVADPEGTFDRLFSYFGLPNTGTIDRVIAQRVSTPSTTSGGVTGWHHPLTLSEGEEVLSICNSFGIFLYGRQDQPIFEPDEAVAVQ
jgi:hypothetical protein